MWKMKKLCEIFMKFLGKVRKVRGEMRKAMRKKEKSEET